MEEKSINSEDNRVNNLKPFKKGQSGNPNGRPKGQKNYKTLYKEALLKIAESKGKTADEIEQDLATAGIMHAIKGNFSFYKDVMDRIHGKAEDNVNLEGSFVIKWKDADNND